MIGILQGIKPNEGTPRNPTLATALVLGADVGHAEVVGVGFGGGHGGRVFAREVHVLHVLVVERVPSGG